MAKISKSMEKEIAVAEINDFSQPMVFVVDMINGFIKEGALSDSSIMSIVEPIKNLLKQTKDHIFVCDSHNLDAREFQAYPIHCIENTEESQVIDELKGYVDDVIYKNSTNTFVSKDFQDQLEELLLSYNDYIIVGCCSDICVLQFALAFQTFLNEFNMDKKRIIVPVNMIETFHADKVHDQLEMNEIACKLMMSNGIDVVNVR
ncbi:isochorismatase family cysteine hydrolase [Breznakia pachnodae]|uniref:Nicotinamidase-related amidase n=1 Tax=Breznakia pachnodae TaxID=265178 RepID=A0ABU0E4Y9_9FIRM|nr:isochorismatase family cysteine hydrolase [Breznakia pachnodae]MDQ0361945.1 nicotinamidase-related amidase [Breznakia pachnodae]